MSKAPAVDYALKIIDYFSKAQKEVGISDICNSLGINKNAVSRVLESLLEQHWIYMSDENQKKYRFTVKPFSIVSKCTPENALVELAKGELQQLNRQIRDAVYLGVKNGENVLYLLHYDSKREVRINGRVGGEYPLRTSAPGKVLLANDADTDEAKRVKETGYAIDNEEFAKGILCIACPVYDSEGVVVAAVGISSLTIYDDMRSLVSDKLPYLRETARKISLRLGYKGE